MDFKYFLSLGLEKTQIWLWFVSEVCTLLCISHHIIILMVRKVPLNQSKEFLPFTFQIKRHGRQKFKKQANYGTCVINYLF